MVYKLITVYYEPELQCQALLIEEDVAVIFEVRRDGIVEIDHVRPSSTMPGMYEANCEEYPESIASFKLR